MLHSHNLFTHLKYYVMTMFAKIITILVALISPPKKKVVVARPANTTAKQQHASASKPCSAVDYSTGKTVKYVA